MLVSACGARSQIIVKPVRYHTESPIKGLMPVFTTDSWKNSAVEVSMGASPTVSLTNSTGNGGQTISKSPYAQHSLTLDMQLRITSLNKRCHYCFSAFRNCLHLALHDHWRHSWCAQLVCIQWGCIVTGLQLTTHTHTMANDSSSFYKVFIQSYWDKYIFSCNSLELKLEFTHCFWFLFYCIIV
jgi:hypothetical protein